MMNRTDQRALLRTLNLAGIENIAPSRFSVLAFSKADKKENKIVREEANKLILALLETGDLGMCIHVTGEMRALTDPFHRRLCEEMKRREKGSFHVLFHVPEEHRQNTNALVAWNLSNWAKFRARPWQEELRTIDVIAQRSVNLLAYDTTNDIQYSVFGHRYILLQEKHKDETVSKRIWLLESEKINEFLAARGRQFISGAVNIDEGCFREFIISLSGIAARWFLSKLHKSSIEKENLVKDTFICNYAQNPQDALDALKVMKFVFESANGMIDITPAGRDFLNSY